MVTKSDEFVRTGLSCFDEVTGGLPAGKLSRVWGALPFVEENLWFGLSLALESASRHSIPVTVVCFQTNPMILKDGVEFLYPGLKQKLRIVESGLLKADPGQSSVLLVDARNADGSSVPDLMRNISAGIWPKIVVMESISTTSKTTGSFDHELFAHLEEYANANKSGIIVIPYGSTYALRQTAGQIPMNELVQKELYSHRPATEHSGLNVFVVPEGELRSPVAGYNWLGRSGLMSAGSAMTKSSLCLCDIFEKRRGKLN